ncbi:hypothetical protein QMG83_02735 [Salinibacterium sp. G-O1]|uniref:hypothetical protein n=1 Tax=Salinibacterium sp. G-O1 TaxID=3046208 RepID=UPI0024BA33BF|nr:hypothetical protein [Salinibacterium sp. G-O1]MDJ0334134.1 hypothetical protein [Salinibacterium sp. G-O1]
MTDTNHESGTNNPNGDPEYREPHDDAVQEAEIVDEPDTVVVHDELIVEDDESTVVEPEVTRASVVEPEVARPTVTEPVVATDDPAAVRTEDPTVAAPQQVVYVQTPAAPRKLGNRGIGTLIALLSALIFGALLAVITAVIQYANSGRFDFGFLSQAQFYIPMLFFAVAFVLLVLLVNRGAWWAYIIGSVLVAVVVYFGTIGFGLLITGVISNTPSEANERFVAQLSNPFVIASALLAREVSLWFGALISRRGRSLKARNAVRREEYERELAERRARV